MWTFICIANVSWLRFDPLYHRNKKLAFPSESILPTACWMQGSEESQSSYPSSTMIRRKDPSRSPLSTDSVGNKGRNNLFQVCALWKILLRPHYFAKLGFRNWWHYRTILSCNLWFLTLNSEDMSKISLNISPLHSPLH